ncbi:amino acid/amide ABC transporter ATP-binding protein 1, HAAT family [Limimonas halophila]|uniref:Amino acid/amide ABC transporter ATP-binding protein 1, HAAT family n=1 Tax=Limimonas halophila TaxID=1082479 RepID=A0A1G7TRZ2_9PROT|nr:ABC transporter ATP-binding protein [Limimonas halophila]SDG37330.1 amino acid/amide ABC transporter ATP-binding protein 1, HAAT family [Limimonas halophila]
MSEPVLAVRGLMKRFGGVVAVDDVTFHLAAGEMLALIGPNGAGKSTCFNCIGGQLKADGGSVRLSGRRIDRLPPRRIWRLGVGRTFQVAATFASMTVAENVQVALLSRARRLGDLVTRANRFQRGRTTDLLARVGIPDLADRPCGLLAYGDVKRAELAVALANDPKLLLMDEPTAGMAPGERAKLMALARQLAHEQGIAVLFTEHDVDIVFDHADRVAVMDQGALIADGPPGRVRNDARVREVYLGGGEDEPAPNGAGEAAPC